jgi:hypothetical protein
MNFTAPLSRMRHLSLKFLSLSYGALRINGMHTDTFASPNAIQIFIIDILTHV